MCSVTCDHRTVWAVSRWTHIVISWSRLQDWCTLSGDRIIKLKFNQELVKTRPRCVWCKSSNVMLTSEAVATHLETSELTRVTSHSVKIWWVVVILVTCPSLHPSLVKVVSSTDCDQQDPSLKVEPSSHVWHTGIINPFYSSIFTQYLQI